MLLSKHVDTFVYELSLNSGAMFSTREVGHVFNQARADIANFFESVDADDKKLTLVDVEHSDDLITIVVDVSHNTYPEVPAYANITFGVNDIWYIEDYGGYVDASSNVQFRPYGSPTILRFYVLSNLGYIGGGTSSLPVNILSVSVPPSGELGSNTSLPTNPLSTSTFNYWFTNHTLVKTNGTTYPQTNPPGVVPYQGMNYFREYGIPYHIDDKENIHSKAMIDFKIYSSLITNGTYNRQHRMEIDLADLIPVTLPSDLAL